MQHREFGKTGAKVSRLGFGAMRLPIKKDEDGKITGIEESAELVRRGIDAGINYVDSAPGYCHRESETAVGLAIKGLARNTVHVSTKNSVQNACGQCFRLKLELSLRKLDCGYIDFYHFWGLSWQNYLNRCLGSDGPLARARKAREEGLIRHISFSCHDTPAGAIQLIDTGHFESMLVQFNLLDRKYAPAIAHAHAKGLGTACMGPVGGGRLGTPSEVIAKATGSRSTAEVAVRFCMANPDLDIVLSGMENDRMVDENVATAHRDEPLSDDELKRIDALAEANRKILDLPCTGCGYCKPCPQGVAIPQVFEMVQWHTAFDLKEPARRRYQALGKGWQEKNKPASECIECGQCEPKCPQKIPIIEKLKEAHATLTQVPEG